MESRDGHPIDVEPENVRAFINRAIANRRTAMAMFYGPGSHDWRDYMTAEEHEVWLATYRASDDWNITVTINDNGLESRQYRRRYPEADPPRRDYVN